MQPLGGLYVVEGYDGKSWAGTRFVTDAYGPVSGPNVTVIGSDDGQTFWSIHGHLTGGFSSAELQLAPTPEDEAGTARAHRNAIVWNDGRKWTRLEAPPSAGMLLPQAAGVSLVLARSHTRAFGHMPTIPHTRRDEAARCAPFLTVPALNAETS